MNLLFLIPALQGVSGNALQKRIDLTSPIPRLKPGARLKLKALNLSLARCFSAGSEKTSDSKPRTERVKV
jgi:hypothetical protein